MMGGILMKKAIICFVTIFACLILTVGCNTYNAKLYNADNWINNDFAEDNLIRNVYYSQSGSGENVLSDDETYPESRTFIVENSEVYNRIFNNDIENFDVDFNKQMLIVYTFRDINHRNLKLISVNLQDAILRITFESISKSGIGDTCMPYQRWIVIKLDKIEVKSVEFIKNK